MRYRALAGSVIVHALALGLVLWLAAGARRGASTARLLEPVTRLVWLAGAGPAGGGGGGGNRLPAPTPIERPDRDRLTTPAETARKPSPVPTPTEPEYRLDAPIQALAAADAASLGVIAAPPSDPASRGPGTGAGAGDGTGSGNGAGTGSGLGPGFGGGAGGGAFRGGNGVSSPTLVRRVPPQYTADAMRARLQGVVILECVVEVNGRCGEIRVVRSLDHAFGLDEKAIEAARRWQFRPGHRLGEPVPVFVTLEMEFAIR